MRTLEEITNDISQLCVQLGALKYQQTIQQEQMEAKMKPVQDQLRELEREQKMVLLVQEEANKKAAVVSSDVS